MPYYCTVPRCTSMAGKAKNVSFHQFPRDEGLANLWNEVLKRGKPYTKYSKVCSLHFKPEDYTMTTVGKNKGQWRSLRKDAVPSLNLPSDTNLPYQRREKAPSLPGLGANLLDVQVQQQVAQAIYMQTMLAMQAASFTEKQSDDEDIGDEDDDEESNDTVAEKPDQSTNPIESKSDQKPPEPNQKPKLETSSYKCSQCSKYFKDPDVYTLHQRTHKNEVTHTQKSNPILTHLLNNGRNLNGPNGPSIDNHYLTAMALNMQAYVRSLSMGEPEDDSASDISDNLNRSNDSNRLIIDETV